MPTNASVTIQLSGVHLCCGGCTDAADNSLQSVPGVESRCNMEAGTVTFTAPNEAAARQALDAFAAVGGLYGHSDHPSLAVNPVGGVPGGKVKQLTLSGIHNCCDLCADAIRGALDTVDGVTGSTVEPLATTFMVTGNFSPAAVVKAINVAGFSARVA